MGTAASKPKEIPEGFAWCGYHKELHPVSEFYKSPAFENGLRSNCKVADKLASKKSRAIKKAVELLKENGYTVTGPKETA